MDGMFLPILIAGSVALLCFTIWQITSKAIDPEKRKLKQRLTTDGVSGKADEQLSITMNKEVTGLSGTLTQFTSIFDGLHAKVRQAYPNLSLVMFLTICGLLAFMLYIIAFLISGSPIVGSVAGLVGAYVPFVLLAKKRNKRQQTLALQLPEALDFLSRILKSGHSLSTGLQMMSEELPKPLGQEFRRAYDQHSLGMTMDDSLKDMATRIESTDFAFFVTAVLIQRQTGGDLSEVLGNISGMIRQRIRLQQHVKAKTAEGRFTGYILSAFPAVMFVIISMMNPDYTSVLWKTTTGMWLLATAFGLMLSGLFCIKKITTVRV
jgi:tight adherence protein B